jgi:hypothetical protein
MRNPFNGDDADLIANGIQNAIPTETDSIRIDGARKLDAAMWARISSEAMDDRNRALPKLKAWKRLELLDCRAFDRELIAFHGA